jgi:diguanylate cyclase (GGDEF)-like protein
VEAGVDEIGTTNVTLKTRISEGVTLLSAKLALATGEEVEGRVQECADDLHEVTESLTQGIEDLKQTERALAQAKAALTDTKVALAIAIEAGKEALLNAQHDARTGLPNRELFDARLGHAIAIAKRHDWNLAVMFLDLDRFKSINDAHGHSAGDTLLKEIAARLSKHVREEDTLCRTGGDEFLYLVMNPKSRQNIERIADAVHERVSQPVTVGGLQLRVGASIGIAVYPADAESGYDRIRLADAEMYRAKKSGSRRCFAAATAEAPGTPPAP